MPLGQMIDSGHVSAVYKIIGRQEYETEEERRTRLIPML